FPQCEPVAAHEQRRQDLEHMVVVGLRHFAPFAGIDRTGVDGETVRALRMAVERAKHMPAVGDALIDIAARREGHGWAPFGLVRAGARCPFSGITIFSSALHDPSCRVASRPVGSRAAKRAEPPLTRPAGMRQAAFLLPSFFSLPLIALKR